jgi:hypothetical protein
MATTFQTSEGRRKWRAYNSYRAAIEEFGDRMGRAFEEVRRNTDKILEEPVFGLQGFISDQINKDIREEVNNRHQYSLEQQPLVRTQGKWRDGRNRSTSVGILSYWPRIWMLVSF